MPVAMNKMTAFCYDPNIHDFFLHFLRVFYCSSFRIANTAEPVHSGHQLVKNSCPFKKRYRNKLVSLLARPPRADGIILVSTKAGSTVLVEV